MGDLEPQTDQGLLMSDSHHSFFESSSVGGMSRLYKNTCENTIPNPSHVAILEDEEMEMAQNGIEMVPDKEESNAESANEGEF